MTIAWMRTRKLVLSRVFKDISKMDPLIIFRCKNKNCRHIFTPAPLLDENAQIVRFKCPFCDSKYEAQYNNVGVQADQKVIMLLERPRLTYLGTKIASS